MRSKVLSVLVAFLIFSTALLTPTNAHAAPAPPLTYLQIKGVASANYPYWENISDSQFSTAQDHGGAWIYVATVEYGYGQTQIATFNGRSVTSDGCDPLVDSSNTIIGYVCYWLITSGAASGNFSYRATSINYPWNTMSDSLTIR